MVYILMFNILIYKRLTYYVTVLYPSHKLLLIVMVHALCTRPVSHEPLEYIAS